MQLGSIEAVVAAIQEDARAEIETIERELAAAVERLRLEDAALPVVVPEAEARIASARRQVHDRTAAEDWADRRAALSLRERWIERVTAKGERKLAALDAAARHADLVDLLREAFARMPHEPLELSVPAGELDVAIRIVHDENITAPGQVVTRVKIAPEIAAGCVVSTADGRFRYENSYSSRARRFEALWRARLGELYVQRLEPVLAGKAASREDAP